MNDFLQKNLLAIASLSLVAGGTLSLAPAALAQATVLTGNVSSMAMAPMVRNDIGTAHYAGANYVNTSEKFSAAPAARLMQNPPLRAGVGSTANYQQSAYRQPARPMVRTVYVRDNRTFFERHPKVKAASIGAGVGAGAGALTGLVTGRGVIRGALIGGGTGAGVGLVRSSTTMRRHPIVRDVATGSLVGLGLGAAGSRYHRTTLEATGLGAAVGLGVGMWKHMR